MSFAWFMQANLLECNTVPVSQGPVANEMASVIEAVTQMLNELQRDANGLVDREEGDFAYGQVVALEQVLELLRGKKS
jgi:hypothetical protein